MKKHWSSQDIPDLNGRIAVITGANGGLGTASTRALARAGATVIMACRNTEKAAQVAEAIRQEVAHAKLDVLALDLARLASIHAFAEQVNRRYPHVDILLNNAGIINMPERRTEDGFESMVGVDFLGHFALTGQLLESLRKSPAARVVGVGSAGWMHQFARIRLHDLNWEKSTFNSMMATGQAKLALQIFCIELDRRLRAHKESTISTVAHPGVADSNVSLASLQFTHAPIREKLIHLANRWLVQSSDQGALPQLYAATADGVKGGDFYGPGGIFELYGAPKPVKSGANARNEDTGKQLWELAEQLTGVRYLS
ncbi:Short-chain dehydrogenase [gamma proteobacterium HdN1]|nr:Short-chain dehydrogenase [gamma proteobacterium HdN1]